MTSLHRAESMPCWYFPRPLPYERQHADVVWQQTTSGPVAEIISSRPRCSSFWSSTRFGLGHLSGTVTQDSIAKERGVVSLVS